MASCRPQWEFGVLFQEQREALERFLTEKWHGMFYVFQKLAKVYRNIASCRVAANRIYISMRQWLAPGWQQKRWRDSRRCRLSGWSSGDERKGWLQGSHQGQLQGCALFQHSVALRTAGRGPTFKWQNKTNWDENFFLDSSLPRFLTPSSSLGSKQSSNLHVWDWIPYPPIPHCSPEFITVKPHVYSSCEWAKSTSQIPASRSFPSTFISGSSPSLVCVSQHHQIVPRSRYSKWGVQVVPLERSTILGWHYFSRHVNQATTFTQDEWAS